MANNAFDAMNDSVGGDMYLTGGAITVSEYEQNMGPDEQSNYEDFIDRNFKDAWFLDPYKGDLSYSHWLKSLNVDLVAERAAEYEEIKHGKSIDIVGGGATSWLNVKDIYPGMTEYGYAIVQNAGVLQNLAQLHTGRIEDLIAIAAAIPDTSTYQGEGSIGGRNRDPLGQTVEHLNLRYPEGVTDESRTQELMPLQEEVIRQGP
jgi:hypothetical protein